MESIPRAGNMLSCHFTLFAVQQYHVVKHPGCVPWQGVLLQLCFCHKKFCPLQEDKKSFGSLLGKGKKEKKVQAGKLLPSCGVVPSPEHHTATWESEKSSGASTPGGEKTSLFVYLSSRSRGASKTKQMGNQHTEIPHSSPKWSCGAEVEPVVRPSAVFWPLLGHLFLRMITAC